MLLSPMELDTTMRMILQVPIWAQRVIYIQGSCLKDGDLARARMNEAEACFVLAARNYADKTAADEHTILRLAIDKNKICLLRRYYYYCYNIIGLSIFPSSSVIDFLVTRIKHCNPDILPDNTYLMHLGILSFKFYFKA